MKNIRKLTSGRYQVRFSHGGSQYKGPHTFRTVADARAWMDNELTELRRGTWSDPRGGRITLANYAASWLGSGPRSERTVELYQQLLCSHIYPAFGDRPLSSITPAQVRAWHAALPARIVAREAKRAHPRTIDGRVATAKAYRLLASIMRSAVADELIPRSPCRLAGASKEISIEREVVTVDEADALAEALPERYSAVVPLIMWCQLRQGEWMGLRREAIDIRASRIVIRESRTKRADGKMVEKAPKSAAGSRVLAIPSHVVPVLRTHLARFVAIGPKAYVFTGAQGKPLHPGTWYKAWGKARAEIGRPDLRPHDLRHSGLTLLAQVGATTQELMYRAGHSSPAAAMRYQHATLERDKMLAGLLAQGRGG